jgi:CAI-1 autoinducer synthase
VNGALLRFTLNSELTDAQVDRVLAACADVREELQLDAWPSTRRMHMRSQQQAGGR